MTVHLRFSHKVLLAASLVVIAAFSLFTLYNDYFQRDAIRTNLESHLEGMSKIAASNVQAWLSGRVLLIDTIAQTVANDNTPDSVVRLLEQQARNIPARSASDDVGICYCAQHTRSR